MFTLYFYVYIIWRSFVKEWSPHTLSYDPRLSRFEINENKIFLVLKDKHNRRIFVSKQVST